MKIQIIFLALTLSLLISCVGQNQANRSNNAESNVIVAHHDTVKDLGTNIMTIYQDGKGYHWFGSWNSGLYRYDGNYIIHFTKESGLPGNRVEEIREDKSGNLYFNTNGGLCKFDGKDFKLISPKENKEWRLSPDDLWFKSLEFDGKVYRFDGENLFTLTIPESDIGKDWVNKHPTSPNPYAVYTIYSDSKGFVWFGTAVLGACRFNGKTFDWISENDVTELHYGPSNGIRSIIEDKNGYFWFNSAYRYNVYNKDLVTNKAFYIREKNIGNLDRKPDSDFWEYMSVARDDKDNLWIVTYSQGVWRYDGTTTKHYPVKDGENQIKLYSIYKDHNGDIWLGTHENGAYKLIGESFEPFTAR